MMAERKIDDKHTLYTKNVTKWKLIDDICDSENIDAYILPLNPKDESTENVERNKQYRARAIFAAFAGYTARGLVGMIFRKWPKLEAPAQIDYITKNVDGSGNSIYQQSQIVARDQVRKGRAGLLVDYPPTDGGVSVMDLQNRRVFATIQRFSAEQIYHWSFISEGAQIKLSRVVLGDSIEVDGTSIDIIREVMLVNGVYVSREWRKEEGKGWVMVSEYTPTDRDGNTWSEIPFIFVGSETNTHTIDPAPMYDICKLNIGHLNNSADYEDSVHVVGQAQPWMSGLTEDSLRLIKQENMYIGSGRLLGVPSGEQFAFAQAAPNPICREAMQDKLTMAVGLGAMFIQPGSAVKTAAQAEGEQQVQHSVLSLIASNLSEAYTQCLKWMARFMNGDENKCEYTVQQDFIQRTADAQMYLALLAGVNAGRLPVSDFVAWQQKNSLIDPEKTPEEVIEELGPTIAMPDLSGDVE